jgi:hypothetical protein
MRVVGDRLSLRWYLGDDFSEHLPDHASLTRIRERDGPEVFRRFFAALVEQCIAARVVWGAELFIDSTAVGATAAIDSLQPRFAVEAHLGRLFAVSTEGDDGDSSGGGEPEPTPLPIALTEAARVEPAGCAADRHDWLGGMGRPARSETSGPHRRTADCRVGTTDPDASPLRPNGTGARLGYHDHDVVDGGKARIALTVLVTPVEVQDNQPAVDVRWHPRFRRKLRPRQVTGDGKYGTAENVVAIEDQLIRAYVPLAKAGQHAGVFGEPDFHYDPTADVSSCPGENALRFLSHCTRTHRRIHQASAADCAACPRRAKCTSSPRGRRVSRSLHEDVLDRVRGYHGTEAHAKSMRKRKVWVEPLFAEAKEWHGLRRVRLRGAEKVTTQAHLIATGQNPKRLLSKRGWGRRPWPNGAAGLALPALPVVSFARP